MNVEPEKLEKFLFNAELVTQKEFDRAVKLSQQTNKKLGDVLVSQKLVSQEKLSKYEAYLSGIAFVNLEKETVAPEILNLIPENIARAHNIIAFRKLDNNLEVAMLDPEDLITIEFIKKTNPFLRILPRLTTPEGIKNALRQYQKTLDIEFGNILKSDAAAINHVGADGDEMPADNQDLAKVAQELPVIKVVDTLLKHAILQRASDIHVEPLEKEVVVRFRVDGILH